MICLLLLMVAINTVAKDIDVSTETVTVYTQPVVEHVPEVIVVETLVKSEPPTCEEIIIQVAEKYEIAPTLMLALAEVESSMNPDAVSSGGDHGLMQINKINHEWLSEELGITDWYDVRQNTEAACYILNWLRDNYEECEDVSCCLMAYNMGIKNARKLWEQGIYESEYSKKVLDLEYEIGRSLYDGT